MFPDFLSHFLQQQTEILWLLCLCLDLMFSLLLYRLYGSRGLYAAVMVGIMIANLQGPKLTTIFGFQTSLGVILYSGIYFATDLLSENYGKREANRAVMLGFAVSVWMLLVVHLGLLFAPTQQAETREFAARIHEAMQALFELTPRFVFGSLLAYLISQRFDVWAFHAIRQRTGRPHLWLRNTGSTALSQGLDTLIYGVVVWWGIVDFKTAMQLALVKYVIKLFIAVFDTPFIYWARRWQPAAERAHPDQRFSRNQSSAS